MGITCLKQGKRFLRFAPRYGTKFDRGLLHSKITNFENWIKKTLSDVPQVKFPQLLGVRLEMEQPRNGETPFEILKARFADDEHLWDIKQLLIGSKENEIPGFPVELENLRSKIHISRDSISEQERRLGLNSEGGF